MAAIAAWEKITEAKNITDAWTQLPGEKFFLLGASLQQSLKT